VTPAIEAGSTSLDELPVEPPVEPPDVLAPPLEEPVFEPAQPHMASAKIQDAALKATPP
jgi:hypothetical protein